MESRSVTLNRWVAGLAALGCFAAAAVVAVTSPDEPFWWGGFLRAGVVLAALWACLPTRTRPAVWADFKPLPTAILLGALLLAVVRPKIGLPVLLVVLAARWVTSLRRPRNEPARRGREGLFG